VRDNGRHCTRMHRTTLANSGGYATYHGISNFGSYRKEQIDTREYASNGLRKIARGFNKVFSNSWTYAALTTGAIIGGVAYGAYTGQIQFVINPAPTPHFSAMGIVAFSALAASLY
jgi:hypothetical protein